MVKLTLRMCKDINMWALDRPIDDIPDAHVKGSCIHKTSFCKQTCYNVKLYRMFPNMRKKDIENEQFWQALPWTHVDWDNEALALLKGKIDRMRKRPKRIRLMTRGEAFSSIADVFRVKVLCEAFPDIVFWCPTRAWRQGQLRGVIRDHLFEVKNLNLNASLDPTTTHEEKQSLFAEGWSTMFYGDDGTEAQAGRFLCPKTHKKLKKICTLCNRGCFRGTAQGVPSHVHLSQH